jgi:hypothetical protein
VAADLGPVTIFWSAVTVDVFTLGVAWSAWKSPDGTPATWAVAATATLVCVAATIVAGRILIVISRTQSRPPPAQRAP